MKDPGHNTSNNLERTRYDDVVTAFYDSDFSAVFGGEDRGDLPFLSALAAQAGGHILEVGAGTGRALIPVALAAPQAQVIGVEPSAPMRAAATARAVGAGAAVADRVTLIDGHFGALGVADTSQDFVYTAFRSFQHVLTPTEQMAGLREIHRVMRPDATLLLDVFDPDYRFLHDADFQCVARYATPAGNSVERWDARVIDRVQQQVDVRFRWVEAEPDGTIQSEREGRYVIRYTFYWELRHLLARCGFTVTAVYGGYDGAPLGDEPGEIIVLAKRTP